MALDHVRITLSPDLEPMRNVVREVLVDAGFAPVDEGTCLDLTGTDSPPTVWLDADVPPDADIEAWSGPGTPLQLAVEAVHERASHAGAAAAPRRAGAPHVLLTLRDHHGHAALRSLTAEPQGAGPH